MSKTARRVIIVIAAIVVVFCCVSFVADRFILQQTYERTPAREASLIATYEDFADAYPRTDVSFEFEGYTLRGHVYGPENTRGFIVFRHGIFSQHQDYLALITAMVDKGWRVFAYDAIGCGESDGDSTLGMSQSPRDVAAAVRFVQETNLNDGMKIALWGHSWGGYGVAAALGKAEGVDACVTMSGFNSPMEILLASAQNSFGPAAITQAPFLWLNTALAFGSEANVSASDAVTSSGVSTLVIHGTGDKVVPYEDVSILDTLAQEQPDAENVASITCSEEKRNGHNDYFYSRESQAYLGECTKTLTALMEEHDGDANAPEVVAYRESVDMIAANTADPELIDAIDSFLGRELA